MAQQFRLVKYYNLPRDIHIYIYMFVTFCCHHRKAIHIHVNQHVAALYLMISISQNGRFFHLSKSVLHSTRDDKPYNNTAPMTMEPPPWLGKPPVPTVALQIEDHRSWIPGAQQRPGRPASDGVKNHAFKHTKNYGKSPSIMNFPMKNAND